MYNTTAKFEHYIANRLMSFKWKFCVAFGEREGERDYLI